MADGEASPHISSRGQRWIEVVVVVGIIVVLIAIMLPAVLNARNAARLTQSKNNLRQLGLAFHNYHDVYRRFPIGGDVDASGTAKHGWMLRLIAYVDANAIQQQVDMDFAWNHPVNQWVFQGHVPVASIPGVAEHYTSDRLALLHYMGNPNVLHRNKSVTIDQMTAGTANTWLLGEVSGNYQPWGYPFNWRPLSLPLNSGPDTFGRPTEDGAQFCLADGSVRLCTNEIDPAIINGLATAPPIASPQDVAQPVRLFGTQSGQGERIVTSLHVNEYGARLNQIVCIDGNGVPQTAVFSCSGKGGCPAETTEDVRRLASEYPELRVLIARQWSISDDAADALLSFRALESLYIKDIQLSEAGIRQLRTLSRLSTLICSATESQASQLSAALPECEFVIRPKQ